jgi:peptidyl-prolyl cis-trans isomerase C
VKRIPFIKHLVVAVAAASLLSVAACKKADEPKTGDGTTTQASSTGPVAKVNSQEISRGDFDKQMERTRSRFQRAGRQIAPALETRLKENLVRKMVEEELIAQKAKAEGVTVEATELDAKFAEHKGRFGSDKAFAAFLERTNQTEVEVKQDLEKNLLRDKLFTKLLGGTEPTDADAQKYYEENKDKYKQKEQIKASHILFKVDKTTAEADKKKKLDQAKKVLGEAKKAGVDFEELAKKYSEGPTAPRGGDLGTFSRGRMVKPFEDVAFAAKAGEVLGPVETQFGYHVIKVYEKTPEVQRPFEEVKESILTSLKARQKSKATRELLDKLKAEAKVEVLEPGVSLEPKHMATMPIGPDGQPMQPVDAKELREQMQKGGFPGPKAMGAPMATDPAASEGAVAPPAVPAQP